jgi:hypothetical protein
MSRRRSRLRVDGHPTTTPADDGRPEVIEMRTIAAAACVAGALVLSAPGAALARDHHHHHPRSASHHRRARHARVERFTAGSLPPRQGHDSNQLAGADGSTQNGAAPPTGEEIGKVVSFEGGTLKVLLSDESTVSGGVTGDTDITCVPSEPVQPQPGDDDEDGSDRGTNASDASVSSTTGVPATSGDDEGGAQDEGENEDEGSGPEGCGEAALVPGAVVREAVLRLSAKGTTFEEIELVR